MKKKFKILMWILAIFIVSMMVILLWITLPVAYRFRQYNNIMYWFADKETLFCSSSLERYYEKNNALPEHLGQLEFEAPKRIKANMGVLYLEIFYDSSIDLKSEQAKPQIVFATYNPLNSVQRVITFDKNRPKRFERVDVSVEEFKKWYDEKIKETQQKKNRDLRGHTTIF